MDLMRMEKKNNGDKYISVAAVLEDIQLLRNNAHLYNQGEIELKLSQIRLCIWYLCFV